MADVPKEEVQSVLIDHAAAGTGGYGAAVTENPILGQPPEGIMVVGGNDGRRVNLSDTFSDMMYRRLQRARGGYYKEQDASVRFGNDFFTFLICVLVVSVGASSNNYQDFIFALLVGIILIVLIRKLFGAYKFVLLWFFVGWMVMTFVTGSLLGLFTSNYDSKDGERGYNNVRSTVWALIAGLSVMTIFVEWLRGPFYMKLLKQGKISNERWFQLAPGRNGCEMTYRSKLNILRDWAIEFLRLFSSTFRREGDVRVRYMGGVDDQNRPHGVGFWSESSPHGEELAGVWCHGKLSSPFQSTEKGSGYAFSAVRVAVVRDRLDKLGSNDYVSKFDPDGISYGVATVECSVSGKFFKHLPQVQWIHEPAHGRDAEWALSHLITPADPFVKGSADYQSVNISMNKRSGRMMVSPIGLQPTSLSALATITVSSKSIGFGAANAPGGDELIDAESGLVGSVGMTDALLDNDGDNGGGGGGSGGSAEVVDVELGERTRAHVLAQFNAGLAEKQLAFKLDGWAFVPKGFEAVVLIPGYNACTDFSVATLAQLLTLGHFPPSVLPFVWSWPSCWMLTYPYAKKNGLDPRLTEDFQVFLGQLKAANVRKLHVMTHSAGLRVFMTMIKGLEGYLAPLPTSTTGSLGNHHLDSQAMNFDVNGSTRNDGLIALETVTMMNGDYELESFLAEGGGYDILRAYCPVLTIYADETDGALGYLELLTRKKTVGCGTYRLKRRPTSTETQSGREADAAVGQFHVGDKTNDVQLRAREKAKRMDQQVNWCVSINKEARDKLPKGLDEFRPTTVLLPPVVDSIKVQERKRRVRRRKDDDDDDLVPLDLDVIDMKWLEQNIHAIRHSFFNINPVLVQDLREIIVDKRRASQRGNTRSQGGNVFSFMIAPEIYKMP